MMRKLLHTPVSNQASLLLIFVWTHLLCQANLLITSAAKSSCWIRLSLFSQECLSHSLFVKPCPWLLQNITQIMRSQRRNCRQTSKILVSHASIISAFLDIWLFFISWLCTQLQGFYNHICRNLSQIEFRREFISLLLTSCVVLGCLSNLSDLLFLLLVK